MKVGETNEAFELYDAVPDPLPLDISNDIVQKVAKVLMGSAGMCRVDSVMFRNWELRFVVES